MLPGDLLEDVKRLDNDDKLKLLQILVDDLSLTDHGYEIFGYRGNHEIAGRMLEIMERQEASSRPEIK